MTSSRLPRRFLLRALLAFSILVCILVPVGLFGFALVLRNYLYQTHEPVRPPTRQVASGGLEVQPPVTHTNAPQTSAPTIVGTQIADVISSSQEKSTEENLHQLDAMSSQLKSVTSDKSVDDIASNVQQWMGLQTRASKAKAASTIMEFDIDTAQLHSVDRQENKPGKMEYKAVLIDAQGRTVEIKLTEAEGKETYALMQRIKANPLLEKVYRQIAMPILDSLVQSARDQLKSPATARPK